MYMYVVHGLQCMFIESTLFYQWPNNIYLYGLFFLWFLKNAYLSSP